VKHEAFVFAENGFEIWTLRIDPEFDHPARGMKAAWDKAASLALADVADIDNDEVWISQPRYKISRLDLADTGTRVSDKLGR
jgi:hypothetical protein